MSTVGNTINCQDILNQVNRLDERVRFLETRSEVDNERWNNIYGRFDKMEKDINSCFTNMEKNSNKRFDTLETAIAKNSGNFTRIAWSIITPLIGGIIYLIIRGGLL